MQAAEFAGHLPSDDDEIGHVILHDQYVQDATEYGLNDRLAEVLEYAATHSRKALGVLPLDDSSSTEDFQERRETLEDARRIVVQELCPLGVRNRRDASIVLDYIPYIRQIVEAEDAEEAREIEKKPKGRRSTRNSARSGYVRIVEVSGDSRRSLARMGLM